MNICHKFGLARNIQWNATKTYVIRFKHSKSSTIALNRRFSPLSFPGSEHFKEVAHEKWLGYILCDDFSDDKHIQSQTSRIYCATNQILDNINPHWLERKAKRSIINAYGSVYLLGTFNKYKITTFNALKTAHRYLVRKITGMFDRNNLFII